MLPTAHTISQRLRTLKRTPPELIPIGMRILVQSFLLHLYMYIRMLTVLSRICPSVRYTRDRSIALANYTSSFANTFPSHTALPSAQASTPPAGNSCTTRPSAFLDPSLRTGVKFSRRRDVVGWRREPLVFLARSTVKLRRTDLYSTNCFDSGLRWFHWYLQIYFRDPVRSKQATQENTKKTKLSYLVHSCLCQRIYPDSGLFWPRNIQSF